ncbi:MAG: S8 family serine peptidase, partial [Thermomicrobiales bacterium]|nr:S8 family serine peptidase [Thermomicrobiales bacterium]
MSRAMHLGLLALLVLTPLMATWAPGVSAQEPGATEPASGNVIVVLRDSVQLAEATDITDEIDNAVSFGAVLNGFAAELTPEEAADLADDPRVAGIYPDEPVYLAEEYTNSLGVRRIGAPSAHVDLSEGLPSTVSSTVAVVDSGVLYNHPNLNVVGGFDALSAGNPDTGATDCGALTPAERALFEDDGPNTWGSPSNLTHGTLVSGIIGAKGVGGVTGVAPGAGIVAIKVS